LPKVYTVITSFIQNFTVKASNYITTTIPVAIPNGLGAEHAGQEIMTYAVDHPTTVRVVGREGGEIPGVTAIGLGVTLAPAQIDDFNTNASLSRHISDGLIDTLGFGLSEGGGALGITATAGLCGPCGPLGGAIANLGVGAAYDNRITAWNWRNDFPGTVNYTATIAGETIKYNWEGPPVDPNSPHPSSVPTP
jgi:hypothetical protein